MCEDTSAKKSGSELLQFKSRLTQKITSHSTHFFLGGWRGRGRCGSVLTPLFFPFPRYFSGKVSRFFSFCELLSIDFGGLCSDFALLTSVIGDTISDLWFREIIFESLGSWKRKSRELEEKGEYTRTTFKYFLVRKCIGVDRNR